MSGLLDDVFGGADAGSDTDAAVEPAPDSTTTAGALDFTMAERTTSTTSTSTARARTSTVSSSARTSTVSSSATSSRATSTVSSSRVSSSTTSAARTSAVTSSRTSTAVPSSTTSARTSSTSSTHSTSTRRTSTTSSRSSTSTKGKHTSISSSETDSATSTGASSTVATTSSSSATSSATAGLDSANSSSSSSSSHLSTGAIVGIVIGCVVGIALLFLLATRYVRQKRRNDRMKRRSSMFDWPAGAEAPAESYEKPQQQYNPPSESFAMSEANPQNVESVSYSTSDAYAAVPAESSTPMSYIERHNPQASYSNSYRNSLQAVPGLAPSYPPGTQMQPGQVYPQQGGGQGYGAAAGAAGVAGVGAAGAAAASRGGAPARNVAPNSWVTVKVGFVRSLDDELAVTPGQKLFLHEVYDDDWTLCEDEQQRRGVVPVSCLGPLAGGGAAPSTSGQDLQRTKSHQSVRRESLAPGARQ
ncbi:hypothetical protein IAR50_004958 [Cryptococcus sp. DSM 104548]